MPRLHLPWKPSCGTWRRAQHLAGRCSVRARGKNNRLRKSLGKGTTADISLFLKYNDLKHKEIQTSQSKQNSLTRSFSIILVKIQEILTQLPPKCAPLLLARCLSPTVHADRSEGPLTSVGSPVGTQAGTARPRAAELCPTG